MRSFFAAAFLLLASDAFAQRVLAPVYPTPYTLMSLGPSADPAITYAGRVGPLTSPLVAREHTTIIVTIGDSLSDATDDGPYITTHPAKVQDISLDNGQLYQAAPPALSGGGPGNNATMGFWGHRLADKLIDAGKTSRVIVACGGVNYTNTTLWTTAPYWVRISALWGRLNNLNLLGADRIVILVSLGGRDQMEATPAATVKANLDILIGYIRQAGFLSTPIYLAGSSWGGGGTGGANGVAVRSGIANAIAANHNTYAGADTDTIPLTERYDGNHYGAAAGSDHAATLWRDVIQGSFP